MVVKAAKSEEQILQGLNTRQKQAVEHDQGPLLIIAGAGTGKTTVITRRIAYLITTKRAAPEQILALTFTDKAAREMEERVDLLVPYGYTDIWISTFHAFGDRILREHALELGLDPEFQVLAPAEQLIFLKEHLYEFPLDYYRPKSDPTRFLNALIVLFSRLRDEDVSWEEYLRYAQNLNKQLKQTPADQAAKENAQSQLELARAYETYQKLLMREGKVDFANQVYLALHLFRRRSLVLKRYQEQFKYILVDEFQDTNFSQFQMVKLLAEKSKNIVVVGDDNQSIFKFRGAAISNILNFMEHYPEGEKIVLTENYRSTQVILDSAYRLIKYNDPDTLEVRCSISKRLLAQDAGGTQIQHLHFDTGSSEADELARLIEERVKKEAFSYGEIAILVRSNNDADNFLRALNMRSIPWRFSGNQGLYGQQEVRFLISFLRTIANPDDSISLYYLISFPEIYNLNMPDLIRCLNWADRKNRSLFSVFKNLPKISELSEISAQTKEKIKQVVDDIEHYLTQARDLPSGKLLYLFLQQSGYIKKLLKEENLVNEQRVKNIARFFNIVANFENLTRQDRLVSFVQHLDLLISCGDDPPTAEADLDLDAVNVLTIHKAKGLEFRLVFIVNLVQGRFPWPRRTEPIEVPLELVKDILPSGDYHIQEERRLFYVAMTRAKRELYFTSALDYGGKRARKVSQFVFEALDISPQKPEIIKKQALEEIKRFAPRVARGAVQQQPISSEQLLVLSFRQIDDYLTCPLKYKYVHILRIPILRHHSVVYGSAIHKAILDFYQAKIQKKSFSVEKLLKSFAAAWVNEGFLSRAHEEQRFNQGKDTLKHFFEREQKRPVPAYIEQPFNFVLGKDKLIGRWDRVDEDAQGEAVIVDFKTSDIVKKQKQADQRVKESLQLSIYALAYKMVKGKLPCRVEFHFVDTGLVGQSQRTEDDLEKTRGLIEQASQGIRARAFQAQPSYRACTYCAYREVCPDTASAR
ncbi:MAG: UvrD-helicase domain-containing protein [Candidatus Omnitrophica bacterium]|nr:UvrD-helicase domain-containing protein [Candidatus Omnitrophota bacterium]